MTTGRNRDDGRSYFAGFLLRQQRIGTRGHLARMDVIWIVIGAILLAATALLALLFFHESPTVTILLIWKANDVPSSDLKDLFSLVSGPQVAARRIHLDRRPLLSRIDVIGAALRVMVFRAANFAFLCSPRRLPAKIATTEICCHRNLLNRGTIDRNGRSKPDKSRCYTATSEGAG